MRYGSGLGAPQWAGQQYGRPFACQTFTGNDTFRVPQVDCPPGQRLTGVHVNGQICFHCVGTKPNARPGPAAPPAAPTGRFQATLGYITAAPGFNLFRATNPHGKATTLSDCLTYCVATQSRDGYYACAETCRGKYSGARRVVSNSISF